jgi:hypothetical protein
MTIKSCETCLYKDFSVRSDTCKPCLAAPLMSRPNWTPAQDEVADVPIFDATQQKVEPGWKQDGGKARMDLIAPEMMQGLAEVLTFGAAKYAPRNWEKGMSWGRCFGALMRHLWAWWAGARHDPETGLSHLSHAACCLMFLAAYEARQIGTDDRKVPVY